MSKYLPQSVISQITSAENAITNDDDVTLSEIIYAIEIENGVNENEIYRNRVTLNLSDEHPILQFLLTKKSLLETLVTLFTLYLRYIIDNKTSIPKQDYVNWARNYNDFYKTQPLSIFNAIKTPRGLNFGEEEYTLYLQIKTALNPLGRTTDNPTVNYGEFYYVIADPLQKTQIKLTKKLPPPVNTNFWYFFKSLEDINLYYKKYPLEYTDTTFNPPVVVRAFKVAIAKCSITLDYVNRVPPYDDGDIPIYSVNDIYNYYITVCDVIDYTLFASIISYSRTKRIKRGRR